MPHQAPSRDLTVLIGVRRWTGLGLLAVISRVAMICSDGLTSGVRNHEAIVVSVKGHY